MRRHQGIKVWVQVRTILSQNTTDITSHRAFASLKEAFPTWEEVLGAPSGLHAHRPLCFAYLT